MSLKRLLLIVALVAGVALVVWLRSGVGDYRNFPPHATGPWVAFGDSLTEGYGASPGRDYPARLSQTLGITITNLGRSGETTDGGLARLDEVLRLQPRVVLLCLGGVDSLESTPRERTFLNLGTIVDRLHQAGSFVVLIGVHSASLRDRNAEFYEALAKEKQVFYIPDIMQGVLFRPIYMSDAIHPNDEGYERIAERLGKNLRPLLPKLQPNGPG